MSDFNFVRINFQNMTLQLLLKRYNFLLSKMCQYNISIMQYFSFLLSYDFLEKKSMDYVGLISPPSSQRNKYIIVATQHLTKWRHSKRPIMLSRLPFFFMRTSLLVLVQHQPQEDYYLSPLNQSLNQTCQSDIGLYLVEDSSRFQTRLEHQINCHFMGLPYHLQGNYLCNTVFLNVWN